MNQVWLEPWIAVTDSQRAALKNELQREITLHHPLFGQTLEPIGRSLANDDVLFIGEDQEFVVVHLTWSGPGDYQFPLAECFATWPEFADKKMAADNAGY